MFIIITIINIIIIIIIIIFITIYHQLKYCYLIYNLGYDSENKFVSTLTFRKLFTNLTQKVISTSKTEMKSKYETKSSCTPVNNTGIRIIFCGYPRYTTICILNQQNHIKKLNNPQKQEKYMIEISECAWIHNLLLLWMFNWIPQNKIISLLCFLFL